MPEQLGDGTWQAKLRGKDFRFSKWGAEKSLMTFAELSKVAAHGLGDASAALNSSNKDEIAGLILSLVVKGVGEGLGADPKATLRLVKKLCCDDVFCDGNSLSPDLFDTFFREDVFFALEVAKANLEVQYASFFARLAPAFGLIRDRVSSATRPSTQPS